MRQRIFHYFSEQRFDLGTVVGIAMATGFWVKGDIALGIATQLITVVWCLYVVDKKTGE